MSEKTEKQFVASFTEAWNKVTAELCTGMMSLKLLSVREVRENELDSALAVAVTWSSVLAVSCGGQLSGVFLCLFKSEDSEEMEKLLGDAGAATDKSVLFQRALEATKPGGEVLFGKVISLDLSASEKALIDIVKGVSWMSTCSFSLSDKSSQVLMLHAPAGELKNSRENAQPQDSPATAAASAVPASSGKSQFNDQDSVRLEGERTPLTPHSVLTPGQPPNFDRLLDVELEIIVRFGLTLLPLRDVARLGIGSMIELDRTVDEPVELLVNGRPLARGTVVVIDGYYGVRITDIEEPPVRRASLMNC
jgi:flagellar motor switch protein FliN